MKDSPCKNCHREKGCRSACGDFKIWFCERWRALRRDALGIEPPDAPYTPAAIGRKPKYYTIRLRGDGRLLAAGTSMECAKAMGMSQDALLATVSAVLRGKNKKYTVLVED